MLPCDLRMYLHLKKKQWSWGKRSVTQILLLPKIIAGRREDRSVPDEEQRPHVAWDTGKHTGISKVCAAGKCSPLTKGDHLSLHVQELLCRRMRLGEETELEKTLQSTSTQDSDVFSDSLTRNVFNRLSPVGFIMGAFLLFTLIKTRKWRSEWSWHSGGRHLSLSFYVTNK